MQTLLYAMKTMSYNKSQLKGSLFLMLLSFIVFLINIYPNLLSDLVPGFIPGSRGEESPRPYYRPNSMFIELAGNIKEAGVYNFLKPISLGKIMEKIGIKEENLGLRKEDFSIIINNGTKLIIQSSPPRILIDRMSPEKQVLFSIPMDLKEVDFEALTVIPGIGPKRALQILRLREEENLKTISDLKKIRGIGEKTYQNIKKYLTVP